MNKKKIRFLYLVLIIVFVFFVFWGASIAKCEYLTLKYGAQFDDIDLYYTHTMLAPYDYLKVLQYDGNSAVVYYVQRHEGGSVLGFERENVNSDWNFAYWQDIWSRTGSASDVIWPYIR